MKKFSIPMMRIELKVVNEITSHIGSVKSPEDAGALISPIIGTLDREHFMVILLNTKNKPLGVETVHVGTLNSCVVHPREVFKSAVLSNAAAIILAHNHPSGDTSPSKQDIALTERLIQAGEIIGIEVLDHIIINNQEEYTSLKEQNFIP